MLSSTLMSLLIVAYLVIAVTSALETNWPRVLYFISAGGITIAVLLGTK